MAKKTLNVLRSIRHMLATYTDQDRAFWAKLTGYEPDRFNAEMLTAAKEGDAEDVLASLIEARLTLEEEEELGGRKN